MKDLEKDLPLPEAVVTPINDAPFSRPNSPSYPMDGKVAASAALTDALASLPAAGAEGVQLSATSPSGAGSEQVFGLVPQHVSDSIVGAVRGPATGGSVDGATVPFDWAEERDPASEQLVNQSYSARAAAMDSKNQHIDQLIKQLAKANEFKNYVHTRLDIAGVESHHEQNAINGCRIGKRLDDVLQASSYAAPTEEGVYPFTIVAVHGDTKAMYYDTVQAHTATEAEAFFNENPAFDGAQVVAVFHGDIDPLIVHSLNGN